MRSVRARSLVKPADVAAVGFVVSERLTNASVTIERRRDGTWRVIDAWARDGWVAEQRVRAIATASAVLSGVDFVGVFVSHFVVDEDVAWCGVWRHRRGSARGRLTRPQPC